MELINNIDDTLRFENKEIRIRGTFENPWFVAKDICDILELTNITNSLRNIPEKWMTLQNVKTSYNSQNMVMISEPAVYKLIMRSNKEIAQKFQEWVCEDVLPSLRKKGEYRMNEEYQLKLKELEEEKLKIQRELEDKEHELEIKEEEKLQIKNELEDRENELEEKEHEIEKKSNRIKLLEKKNIKKSVRTETGRNVVYIITNNYLIKERIYIVGRAVDLANRLSSYNKNAEHQVVYQRECNNAKQMALIEELILCKLNEYRECANRDRFILPEESDISLFTNIMDKFCDLFKDIDKDVVVEKRVDDTDEIYYEDNKEYIREYKRQYHQENKEDITIKNKAWYEENAEQVKIYNQKYQEEKKEEIKEQRAQYRKENKEKIKEQNASYYSENKEEIDKKNKIYQEENREKILEQRKEYYNKNIEEIRAKDRARNPKVMCECGLSICKRSLTKHLTSKTHETFMKRKSEESKTENDELVETETLIT
jgi:prophage antirepressor-like protein